MRLHYLAGNRTGALRTYERCAIALKEGLGVSPSQRTRNLLKLIQDDQLLDSTPTASSLTHDLTPVNKLARLMQLHQTLYEVQQQLEREIEAVRLASQL